MKTGTCISEFLYSRDVTPATMAWYRHKLTRFAVSCPELPDSPALIEAFLSNFNGMPHTKHAYFRTLRAFFRFICKRHKLLNPMDDILPPRRPKKVMPTLQPYELLRLLDSATTLQDRAILTLFIDNGIRTSELANLCIQDIKLHTIIVNGKSGEREVPISDETLRLLALVASQSPDKYVFHNKSNGRITRSVIYKLVAHHMKKVGISGPKFGGHRIRHAFGKNYLVAGGDVRSLQKMMGHASIQTTQQYVALDMSDLTAKHNQFTPLKLAHRAAQGNLFEQEVIKEAEAIFKDGLGGK